MEPAITIHILHKGLPLCDFTQEFPSEWKNALWCRLDEWDTLEQQSDWRDGVHVRCEDCGRLRKEIKCQENQSLLS